jgi:hypothetical protein
LFGTSTLPPLDAGGTSVPIAASTEGTAALQRHAGMAVAAADDRHQIGAQAGGDGVELAVPRAPVAQHRLRSRGGERARGEEDRSLPQSSISPSSLVVRRQPCVFRTAYPEEQRRYRAEVMTISGYRRG